MYIAPPNKIPTVVISSLPILLIKENEHGSRYVISLSQGNENCRFVASWLFERRLSCYAGKLNADFDSLVKQLQLRITAIDGENSALEALIPTWASNQQLSVSIGQPVVQPPVYSTLVIS